MPIRLRAGSGNVVFHVLNRGARRGQLFYQAADYCAFLRVLVEAQARIAVRILCFILMPNHWHLILWPEQDDDLTDFVQWFTMTHALRWHRAKGTPGTGAVYQGRFRAIPVQNDPHFLTVCRYVERNASRAGLVARAEDWPWSSAWTGTSPGPRPLLAAWPVERPACWPEWLNAAPQEREVAAIRDAIRRRIPYGEPEWSRETAVRLHLTGGLRGPGRPRTQPPLAVAGAAGFGEAARSGSGEGLVVSPW